MLSIAHVLKRPLCTHHSFSRSWFSATTNMTRRSSVDTRPPVHREMKDKLERSLFRKTVEVLAVKVPPAKAGTILKSPSMRGYVYATYCMLMMLTRV